MPSVVFNPGLIPGSFGPLQDKAFAFVHIDPALGQTIKDSCQQRVTKVKAQKSLATLGLSSKRVVRSMLLRMGLTIYRNNAEAGYTKYPPYNYATYSPWFETWFQDIYAKVRDHTLVSEDRCYIIYKLGLHCKNLEGDFAECGVYKGGTAFLIATLLGSGEKSDPKCFKRASLNASSPRVR